MKQNDSTKSSTTVKVFDRVLKTPVPGIATTDDRFILENGYYVNESETIILQSTNETGKFFRKVLC